MLSMGSPQALDPDHDGTALHPPPSPTPTPEHSPQCADILPPQAHPQPAVSANTLPRPSPRRRSSGGRHSLCSRPESASHGGILAGVGARPRELWDAAARLPMHNHWPPPGHPGPEDGRVGEGARPVVGPGCGEDVDQAWGSDEVEGRGEDQLLAPTPEHSASVGLDNPALDHTEDPATPAHAPGHAPHPHPCRENLANPWPTLFNKSPRSPCMGSHPLLVTPTFSKEMWALGSKAPLASQESVGVLLSGSTPISPPTRSVSCRSFTAPPPHGSHKSWMNSGHMGLSSLHLVPPTGTHQDTGHPPRT